MAIAFRQAKAEQADPDAPEAVGQQEKPDDESGFRAPSGVSVVLLSPHEACLHTVHTVARLLDGDQLQARVLRPAEALPPGVLPVIVAPSTALAIGAAGRMIGSWHPEVARPVLLVAADAPLPMPRIVAHRVRALEQRVHAVVELGYLPGLREVDDPRECLRPTRKGRPSRAARRLAQLRADLTRLTTPTESPETTEAIR